MRYDVWRKDYAGAWIKKSDYGNCDSDYGWEIVLPDDTILESKLE